MQEVVSIEKWDRGGMWKENKSIDYYDEKEEENQIFYCFFTCFPYSRRHIFLYLFVYESYESFGCEFREFVSQVSGF